MKEQELDLGLIEKVEKERSQGQWWIDGNLLYTADGERIIVELDGSPEDLKDAEWMAVMSKQVPLMIARIEDLESSLEDCRKDLDRAVTEIVLRKTKEK